MLDKILMSQDFNSAFHHLSLNKRKVVAQKIKFLVKDPRYPSLQAHPIKRLGGLIWECSIDRGRSGMRLLYEIQGKSLLLWHLGRHAIVERAHLLPF
ncbi:MAG TPA: hypothetical protein VFN35_02760, partial [Ktedonobacteraceae bacterium]|nr:hypothetical protein [Ktedonobacteraceae bacterium]